MPLAKAVLHFKVLLSFLIWTASFCCQIQAANLFSNSREYLEFHLEHHLEYKLPASDLQLSNRSYLFNVDFTYSKEDGLKVIEYNGTVYFIGFRNLIEPINMVRNFKKYKVLKTRNFSTLGLPSQVSSSGTLGHDQLHPNFSITDIYKNIMNQFAKAKDLKRVESYLGYPDHEYLNAEASRGFYTNTTNEPWEEINRHYGDEVLKANHYGINAFTQSKALINLLPTTEQSSVQLVFTTEAYNEQRILKFKNEMQSIHYIVKPDKGSRSRGVQLVQASDLNLNYLSQFYSKGESLILQSYHPSSPLISEETSELKSPVGRAFYAITFYNGILHIQPVSLYWKMAKYSLKSEADLWVPGKISFTTISHGQSISSKELLSEMIYELNDHFRIVSPSLLEISENGLSGKMQIAQDLRERFHQLPFRLQKKILANNKSFFYQPDSLYQREYRTWKPLLANPLSARKNMRYCKKSAS